MTTAIDTNILVALWNEDDTLNTLARSALDAALGRGSLVIAAPVWLRTFHHPVGISLAQGNRLTNGR